MNEKCYREIPMIAIAPASPNQRSVSKKNQEEQTEEEYDTQSGENSWYGKSVSMHDSYLDIPLDLLLALQDAREETASVSADEKQVAERINQYQETFAAKIDDKSALEDA